MKICIFTNHFFPEDFKVNDIAFELVKKGYNVTVITAVPDYPAGRFYKGYDLFNRRKESVNGVNVIRLPIIPRGRGSAFRLALNYLSYILSASFFTFFHTRCSRYDGVFVHLTSPFFIGLPAVYLKRKQHIPLIFWTLDLWPESLTAAAGITHSLILKPLTKMVTYVYNHCDTILIGSRGFEKSICEKGDFSGKLVYFPNWAELIRPAVAVTAYEKIAPFSSFDENDFVILFAGNIGEAQNLDCVLDAADELREYSQVKFVFMGDGRARQRLTEKARLYGILDQSVFFPGRFPIEVMPLFMNQADILLTTLKNELIFNLTVPSKVQFYMAQGKPVLAMLNGDGADLIREARCGIAVPANDRKAFIQAIHSLLKMSESELLQLGKNGNIFYTENFQKEIRITQLDLLFRSFCKTV